MVAHILPPRIGVIRSIEQAPVIDVEHGRKLYDISLYIEGMHQYADGLETIVLPEERCPQAKKILGQTGVYQSITYDHTPEGDTVERHFLYIASGELLGTLYDSGVVTCRMKE